MVGEVGLEPTKAKPADLQSAPFAARDTPPIAICHDENVCNSETFAALMVARPVSVNPSLRLLRWTDFPAKIAIRYRA